MNIRRIIALILLLTAVTACSAVRLQLCVSGQQAAVQELLYFGAEKPSGRVTPEDWAQFLRETVTPRFPQGFTVWQASGQWLSASAGIVQEPSYVLSLVHPVGASYESAIREIVAAYKTQFQQEAVLQVKSNVCMAL